MKKPNKRTNNSLLRNIMRVLSANFIVAVIGFFSSLIFPIILSLESYAYYQTYILYINYLGILHLGFPSGMAINYAGKDYKQINKEHFKLEVIILMSILSFFSILFFAGYLFLKNEMILFVALSIFPVCAIASYKSLLQAWNRFAEFGKMSVWGSLIVPLMALAIYFITNELKGSQYIYIYLIANWTIFGFIIIKIFNDIKKIKICKKDYRKIVLTEVTGVGVLIGNYINVLLTSADKQFIKWFFSENEFAYYSFGMSMQNLMTVFISSIAQPLFPRLAQDDFSDEKCNQIKDFLLGFGAFSGLAYFVANIIIQNFIVNYTPSLQVIRIYFIIFPLFAVIMCLYVNLYKIKQKMKAYVYTLFVLLLVGVVLNAVCIYCGKGYESVAFATIIVYLIWFIIGLKQFKIIKITRNNILYLLCYFMGYILITNIDNPYGGFFVYSIFLLVLAVMFYGDYIKVLFQKIK